MRFGFQTKFIYSHEKMDDQKLVVRALNRLGLLVNALKHN